MRKCRNSKIDACICHCGLNIAAVPSVETELRNVMAGRDKTLDKILRGTSDANIPFADLCDLLHRLGFDERIRISHHIFTQ